MTKVQAPRGMRDILPPQTRQWERVIARARETAHRCGFREIRTPLLEHTEVFARGVGEGTDIVDKEMYTFDDRGGRSLTLRPEGTAGVARAFVDHGLHTWPQPVKLYYVAEMFRYDRPQAGRYRQHTQFGAEIFGSAHPAADVEVLTLAIRVVQSLGLREVVVRLNSVGCPICRPAYLEKFRAYFAAHADALDEDSRRRLNTNPLRILDSKVASTRALAENAPKTLDSLCGECDAHFAEVRRRFAALGIATALDPFIVRGLDYYTRTAAEILSGRLGAQNAMFGGGRYDGLVSILGGPATPGVGFGMGVDRLLLALEEESLLPKDDLVVDAYVAAAPSRADHAIALVDRLRASGFSVEADVMGRSLAAQMKAAGRAGAAFAIVIEDDEAAPPVMRNLASGDQSPVPWGDVERALARRLKALGAKDEPAV